MKYLTFAAVLCLLTVSSVARADLGHTELISFEKNLQKYTSEKNEAQKKIDQTCKKLREKLKKSYVDMTPKEKKIYNYCEESFFKTHKVKMDKKSPGNTF